jgi:hypothetical protein
VRAAFPRALETYSHATVGMLFEARGEFWWGIQVESTWTPRQIGCRVVALLVSRGPPGSRECARVFADAEQLR